MDQFNDLYNLPEFSMRDYMEPQREFTGDMGNVPVTPQAAVPQAPVYADNVDPNFFNRVAAQPAVIDYEGFSPSMFTPEQLDQLQRESIQTATGVPAFTRPDYGPDVDPNFFNRVPDQAPTIDYDGINPAMLAPEQLEQLQREYYASLPATVEEMPQDFGRDFSREMSFEDYAFQEGGQIPEAGQMQDDSQRLIEMTVAAIRGEVENADQIIQAFVDQYGSDLFMQLRDQVLQEIVPGAQTKGMIQGNGGGQDDLVEGMIGTQRPVAVSPGEYIIPADVVSLAGGGYSGDGAKYFDSLIDDIRQKTMGTTEQIRPYRSA